MQASARFTHRRFESLPMKVELEPGGKRQAAYRIGVPHLGKML
jgi:hypothetical protein